MLDARFGALLASSAKRGLSGATWAVLSFVPSSTPPEASRTRTHRPRRPMPGALVDWVIWTALSSWRKSRWKKISTGMIRMWSSLPSRPTTRSTVARKRVVAYPRFRQHHLLLPFPLPTTVGRKTIPLADINLPSKTGNRRYSNNHRHSNNRQRSNNRRHSNNRQFSNRRYSNHRRSSTSPLNNIRQQRIKVFRLVRCGLSEGGLIHDHSQTKAKDLC